MNKQKEYKWEDSNVADIGSKIDRQVKSKLVFNPPLSSDWLREF